MFIISQKQQQVNSFTFVLTDTLIANGDGPNLILRTFARPLILFSFFLVNFVALTEINIVTRKKPMILHFS